MNGIVLKQIIERSGIRTNVFAEKMGISPQSLNSIFNSSDVKSGTIEKIVIFVEFCVCRVILRRVGTLLRARRKRVKTHANRLKTKTSPLWLLWRG